MLRQDRLETLANVRGAGISVCAGGIIGLGEGEKDRVGLLHQVRPLKACAVALELASPQANIMAAAAKRMLWCSMLVAGAKPQAVQLSRCLQHHSVAPGRWRPGLNSHELAALQLPIHTCFSK